VATLEVFGMTMLIYLVLVE